MLSYQWIRLGKLFCPYVKLCSQIICSRYSLERAFTNALAAVFATLPAEEPNSDPRAEFYALYKKESDEYDRDFIKKYEEDLNTTLIFVRIHLDVSFCVPPLILS